MYSPEHPPQSLHREQGLTLIELPVGIALGLLVILAAIGTLGLSRGLSGSVSEVSQLQQQGSYALQVIGMQFRQTGSKDPDLDPATGRYVFGKDFATFGNTKAAVWGIDGAGTASDSVSVAYFPALLPETHQYDCIGNSVTSANVDATFKVDTSRQLMCTSQGLTQPIIQNVADFRVRYRLNIDDGVQIMDATAVQAADLWRAVTAIEVCLHLKGTEKSPDTGTSYKDCNDTDKPRDGLTHLVFRNVFSLRTQ